MLRCIVPLVGYIATIFLANLSLQYVGWCGPEGPCVIPVWPGLVAPSGVLWAGLAFTLRDLVQEQFGRVPTTVDVSRADYKDIVARAERSGRIWTVGAIVVGAILSALVSPQFAVASGAAFLVSELADFAVYTPLRRRHWLAAVALSNTVGLVADSVLFLQIAFGSLDFLAGQAVGKLWMTVLAVALLRIWRRRLAPSAAPGVS